MNHYLESDWAFLKDSFQLQCNIADARPIESGHINLTYRLQDGNQSWVLQNINHQIFTQPNIVQRNFDKVSAHLARSKYPLANLTVKKTQLGQSLALINGRSWRLMNYVSGCRVLDFAETPHQAFVAAQAVGEFNKALAKLDCQLIEPVIPGFHDLQLRLNQFNQSLLNNHNNRVAHCSAELEVIKQYAYLADWIPKAKANRLIVDRIVHNDTKMSNILIDQKSGLAKAVIDWDTIMPGFFLFDYGDMVRSFVPAGGEDNPKECFLRWEILQGLTEGYLSAIGAQLSSFEKENLLVGAQIIIFMVGVRFLTDYFNGDVYFKTSRSEQNLDRAKTQFELLRQLTRHQQEWQLRLGLRSHSKLA